MTSWLGAVPTIGVVQWLTPIVRRIVAPNPSVFTGPGTNTYLIGHGDELTCVDPGPADDRHIERIAAQAMMEGRRITTIVVTHTHSDHSPGARPLAERTGAVVKGFGPMLRPGVEHHDATFNADVELREGDIAVAGVDHSLVSLHTPGHASNHLCFAMDDPAVGRVLFTGDHVMHGSTVVIAPLDGDMGEYLEHLARIRDLSPKIDVLLPGHGSAIIDPLAYLQGYIDHRGVRAGKVADHLATVTDPEGTSISDLVKSVYGDVDEKLHPIALFSAWAILRQMASSSGTATSPAPDVIEGRWSPA